MFCKTLLLPGVLYNIIRVPPEKTESEDTLQGAKILCSIVPANKSHPSYYHSFGKAAHQGTTHYACFFVFFHLLPSSAKLGNLFLPASSHV